MDPKAPLSCSFDFTVSKESVLLRVILTDGSHGTPNAAVASDALLPLLDSSSKRSQSRSYGTQTMQPPSFQHCFQSRHRPIPYFLHPDVEGPIEEPAAPYTITFKERQYIFTEHASEGARWMTSLMYIFHESQDRIKFCQMIFAKTLLMSAGSDTINHDGQEISHMSAIALWYDDASGTASMTISPNLTGKKATPTDVELKIHGLYDPENKTSRNPKALAIIAEAMPSDDEGSNMSARPDGRLSVRLGRTSPSKASPAPSPKWKKSGKLKCVIRFTRSSDRASFLRCLKKFNFNQSQALNSSVTSG